MTSGGVETEREVTSTGGVVAVKRVFAVDEDFAVATDKCASATVTRG